MKQKRENLIDEDIDLATTEQKYVNGLNQHEINNEVLLDLKVDLELNILMVIGRPLDYNTNI